MALTTATRTGNGTAYPYTERSFSDLRKASPQKDGDIILLQAYYDGGAVGGGRFRYVASDLTSADNGGTFCVTEDGKRLHRILNDDGEVCVNDFGADHTGATSSSDAFRRAYEFARSLPNKRHVRINGKYRLTDPQTIGDALANGVFLLGGLYGRSQGILTLGGSLQDADNDTIMVDIPTGTSVPLFEFGRNAGCQGVTFTYINQDRAATGSTFIQYGATLKASHSFSCCNNRYSGAWDFLNIRGESSMVFQNYGYAINTDYHLDTSGDVCNFEDLHINPNVTRPAWSYIVGAAKLPNSRAFEFIQHDGVLCNNIHVFGKGTVWYNRQNGTSRFCSINGSNFFLDKCGCVMDSDINTSVACVLNNGVFIHDFKSRDGAFAYLSNPIKSQITVYNFTDWKLQLGAADAEIPGTGDWAPYMIYFADTSSISVNVNNIQVPGLGTMQFNNPIGSNQLRGDVLLGSRHIDLSAKPTNLLRNNKLLSEDPVTRIPSGFFVSSNVTAVRNRITSTLAASSNGIGITQRYDGTLQDNSSVWVYATSKGDSNGVTVICHNSDFSNAIEYQGEWQQWGSMWLCRVTLTAVTNRTHFDVCCNAPSATGGALVISSVNLSNGPVFNYVPDAAEVGFQREQSGALRGTVELVAGVPKALPGYLVSARGVYHIYVNTPTSVGVWVVAKRLDGDASTVTEVLKLQGAATLTLDWPSTVGAVPRVTCSSTVTAVISVVGA